MTCYCAAKLTEVNLILAAIKQDLDELECPVNTKTPSDNNYSKSTLSKNELHINFQAAISPCGLIQTICNHMCTCNKCRNASIAIPNALEQIERIKSILTDKSNPERDNYFRTLSLPFVPPI